MDQEERDLVIAFSSAMRELKVLRLLGKPWEWVSDASLKPISDSFLCLTKLKKSTDPELRNLSERVLDGDDFAVQQLREIGVRAKLDH